MQALLCNRRRQEVHDFPASMDRRPIPQDADLTFDMTQQMLHKGDHLGAANAVGVGLHQQSLTPLITDR